jgi:hypothetical protein
MAFPSSTSHDDLDRAWDAIKNAVVTIKVLSTALLAECAAGPVRGDRILGYAATIANCRDDLVRYTAVNGIEAYVRSQINNPTLNLVAEYTAMLTQITATRAWIISNFPHDASNYLLYQTLDGAGRIVVRTFSPAETATFRTQLTALLATID